MIRVRYRRGVGVGETRRVVHAAWSTTVPVVHTLCGAKLPVEQIELIDNLGGMPCMQCTARAALAAEQGSGRAIESSSGANVIELS